MFTKTLGWIGLVVVLSGCEEGFRDPVLIESAPATAPGAFPYFGPKVAADGSQSVVIYTRQFRELRASRGLPWTAPVTVAGHREYMHAHALAVGGDGSAMAVFTRADGTSLDAARFESGSWGVPVSLGEPGARPSVGADAAGNMLAVWTTADGARSARYVVGSGWTPAESIGGRAAVVSLSVATNRAGEGVAAWCERREGGAQIVANVFSSASGWRGATDLASVPACLGKAPAFEFLPDRTTVDTGITDLGVATVVWTDGDLKYRRFVPGARSLWTATQSISTEGDVSNVEMAVNRNGETLVVWQTDGTGRALIEASRFSTASGLWSASSVLAPHGFRPPQIAVGVDDAGRGMVAFINGQAATAVRYDGTSFLAPVRLGRVGDYEIDLAVSGNGYAHVTWVWGQRDLFAAFYVP
jgi:hypothetical protein